MTSAITATGLRKSFGGTAVPDGIDLEVGAAKTFSLLGPRKGPPRKVYSLNAQGQQYLEGFWRTWSFLTERLEQLREGGR